MVLALAKDFPGSCGGLGGTEDVGRGEAEFDYTGTGGVVGLEAVLVTLGTFHGVYRLDLFDWLAHCGLLGLSFLLCSSNFLSQRREAINIGQSHL